MAHLKLMGGLSLDSRDFTQPKPLLLLAYLALEGAQQRRHLAELFWRDGHRMKSLSMTLTRLRQGAGAVIASDDHRAWSTSSSDAADLIAALNQGDWRRAVDLYDGAFLDGVELPHWQPELEDWVLETREYLAARVQHALMKLGEESARRGDHAAGAALAHRALRLAGAGATELALLERGYRLLVTAGHGRASHVRRELLALRAANDPNLLPPVTKPRPITWAPARQRASHRQHRGLRLRGARRRLGK